MNLAPSRPSGTLATQDRVLHDETMPRLAIALDPLLMQLHFQALLFADRDTAVAPTDEVKHEVAACEIVRVKYRAREKCVISYRLQICDSCTGENSEQWLCARVFPTGTAESRYHKALREPLTTPAFGSAVMYMPQLDMVVWAFPNDRKIAGLPELMVTAHRENNQLDHIVAAVWGATTSIVAHEAKLIHYVPEHTCTVRVQLTLRDAETVHDHSATFFGKAYYNDEGAETFRLMQSLWQSASLQQGRLRIARPLAYDPATRLLWQEGLPGRTLFTYDLGTAEFDRLLAEAAQAVALLHTAALPCRRQTNQQDWVGLIAPRQQLVAQSCPHLATAVDTLAVALRCLIPSPSREPSATLHGDLHLQNFFVDEAAMGGGRMALIDLDNLSTGSPWRDLGSFCAGLYYRSLVDSVPQSMMRRSIDGFLRSYAAHVPWALDHQAVNWYIAAALLNERAFRSISRMKEGRLAMVDDFIRIATELLLGK